jgi:hypothetical protein
MSPYIKGEGYIKTSSPDHPCILCGKPGAEHSILFWEEDLEVEHDVDLCGPHYGIYMSRGIGKLYAAVMAREAAKP